MNHVTPRKSLSGLKHRRQAFTLVEFVVTLTLMGILASVAARYFSTPVLSFFNAIQSTQLSDDAAVVSSRLFDEISRALPNSVRVSADGLAIEFLPQIGAGRYRATVAASGAMGDPLDFTNPSDNRFDVFGNLNTIPAGAFLVINNLGTSDGDAWTGNNRRASPSFDAVAQQLTFVPAGPFPSESPSARFALIEEAISFVCQPNPDGSGRIVRVSGYGIPSTQSTNLAAAPLSAGRQATVMSQIAGCSFHYDSTLANLGMMTARFELVRGEGRARVALQIPIDNTP